MKKAVIYFFTIIFSLSWVADIHSQSNTMRMDENQFVFWFYIRAEIKRNRITKKPSYVIRTLSKTPKSGTLLKFDKDLWRNLQGGQNLIIGPFLEYNDAIRAIGMYNLARHTDESMEKEIADLPDSIANLECYFFMLKFDVSKRKRKFEFKRQPARVQPGNIGDFKYALWVNLIQPQLLVGPFPTQEEAEESKRRYRIEED
jgi:hypothetical protein